MALQFSDVTGKQGLIQECETLCFGDAGYGQITSNANLLATFTRHMNEALNSTASLILRCDNRWQWDDNNNVDFPIATTSLVTTAGAEQQDYQFPVTFLEVVRVELKDNTGAWVKLTPIDQADIYDQSLTDFLKSASLPKYYDKIANSIVLYPKPLDANVTASNGLKVWFKRPPSYFATTDTTKVPGFNSLHHKLVALKASLSYAMANSLTIAGGVMRGGFKTGLLGMVSDAEQALEDYYSMRNQDEHTRLSAKKYNFR